MVWSLFEKQEFPLSFVITKWNLQSMYHRPRLQNNTLRSLNLLMRLRTITMQNLFAD